MLPAARALGEWDEVAVARVVAHGRWTACLPVRRYPRWHGLPRCIASWRHRYCLLGTPLLARDAPAAELGSLLGALRAAGRGLVATGLDWVDAEGSVALALAQAAPTAVALDRFDRAAVLRGAEPDYLDGAVKGKHRREFRRLAAGLEQELGDELMVTDATGDPERSSSSSASSCPAGRARREPRLDPARRTRSSSARSRRRSGAVARSSSCSGPRGASSPRATACAPARPITASRSPTTSAARATRRDVELELRQLERFQLDPALTRMDSCTAPDNQLFNRLWPDRRRLVTLCIPGLGPFAGIARLGLRGAVAVRERRRRA